jgi:hypothetical protein
VKICDRVCDGESFREVCSDPAMPTRATVQRWLGEREEFRRYFVFTRELQAEDLFFEARTIAGEGRSGCLEQVRGGKVVTLSGHDEFLRTRMRVHIRCWVAARLLRDGRSSTRK